MLCRLLPALVLVAALSGFASTRPALAQKANNDTLAATMKAAVFVEGRGTASVKPSNFSLRVTLVAEGKGSAATQAAYDRSVDLATDALSKAGLRIGGQYNMQTLRAQDAAQPAQGSGSVRIEQPEDLYKATSTFSVQVRTLAAARAALATLRATGVQGSVVLNYAASDQDNAPLAALKVAIAQAKQNAQVLGDVVKPKELDLVYIKQGDPQFPFRETDAVSLKGTAPLPAVPNAPVYTTATLFYGFKPAAAKSQAKMVAKPAQKSPSPVTVARQ